MDMDQELKHTLTYIQSEIQRIETMAGTLSEVEREHFNKLSNFDHRELNDIAIEEQSASRQLGTIKQMCVTMAQKLESMQREMYRNDSEEQVIHAETH